MSYNLTGAITGGNITLSKAGITGLSGAAVTFSTSAVGGATGLTYLNAGIINYLANISTVAVPVNDASSNTAVAGTAASGAAFRPLVAQQAPAGYSPNLIYPGSAAVFVFGLDPSGNVRVAQGKVVSYTGNQSTPLPELPDWVTPFAYVVISFASSTVASWTFGTSLWNATGVIINTPVNVGILPPVDPIAP
ncbi:MAG: hypothetical protein ACHP7O_05670 [Burkholderiales bacterium]